jgi:hypothetical protein
MTTNSTFPPLTALKAEPLPRCASQNDLARIAAEISATIAVMAVRSAAAHDAKAVIQIYVSDLGDLPSELVLKAIREFRQGERGDGKWLPTPGEIRIAVRNELALREAKHAAEAPSAPPPRFRIDRDSPQGKAWCAHGRAIGVKYPWPNSHWFFESEWPPGFDPDSPQLECRLSSERQSQLLAALRKSLAATVVEEPRRRANDFVPPTEPPSQSAKTGLVAMSPELVAKLGITPAAEGGTT